MAAHGNMIFSDCFFTLVALKDDRELEDKVLHKLRKHGGTQFVSPHWLPANAKTFAVCPASLPPAAAAGLERSSPAFRAAQHRVTWYWLRHSAMAGQLLQLSPATPIFAPLPYALPLPSFATITVSTGGTYGLEGSEASLAVATVRLLGGTFKPPCGSTTRVLVHRPTGPKPLKLPTQLKRCKPAVVTRLWLVASAAAGRALPPGAFHPDKVQQEGRQIFQDLLLAGQQAGQQQGQQQGEVQQEGAQQQEGHQEEQQGQQGQQGPVIGEQQGVTQQLQAMHISQEAPPAVPAGTAAAIAHQPVPLNFFGLPDPGLNASHTTAADATAVGANDQASQALQAPAKRQRGNDDGAGPSNVKRARGDDGAAAAVAAGGAVETTFGPMGGMAMPQYDLLLSLEEIYAGCSKVVSNTRRALSAEGVEVQELRTLTVEVAPGAVDGTLFVFQGEGDAIGKQAAGPVAFVLKSAPHPRFIRRGADLLYNVELPAWQAAVPVRTLDGRVLSVAVEMFPDACVKVAGEGMPEEGGGKGDLFVAFDLS